MEDSLVINQDISANELQVYEICACFWGEFYFSSIYIATRDQVDTKPNLGKNVSLTQEYVKDVRAVANSIKTDQKAYFGTLKKLFNFYHDSRFIYANSFVAFINEFIKAFLPDDIYTHMFQAQKDKVLRRIINRIVDETVKGVLMPEILHLIIDNRNNLSTKKLKDKFVILIINVRNELHREFISGDASLTVEKQINDLRTKLCESERIVKRLTKKYKELKLEYMDLEEDYTRVKSKVKHRLSTAKESDSSEYSESETDSDTKSKKSTKSSKTNKSSKSSNTDTTSKTNKITKKLNHVTITNNRDPNDVLKKRELGLTPASKADNRISNIKIKNFEDDSSDNLFSDSKSLDDRSISGNSIKTTKSKFNISEKTNDKFNEKIKEKIKEIPISKVTLSGKSQPQTVIKSMPPDTTLELKNPINPLVNPVHTMFKQSNLVSTPTPLGNNNDLNYEESELY